MILFYTPLSQVPLFGIVVISDLSHSSGILCLHLILDCIVCVVHPLPDWIISPVISPVPGPLCLFNRFTVAFISSYKISCSPIFIWWWFVPFNFLSVSIARSLFFS